MKVIVLQHSGQVTQADLENILNVQAQLERLQETHDRLVATALSRLTSGAQIEPGPRTCDVKEGYAGGRRVQRLKVW